MFSLLLNPLPVLLTLAASFGVLVHDTQVDHATMTAIALPASYSSLANSDNGLKLNDAHVHTETVTVSQNIQHLRSGEARQQSRNDDDEKYITPKKLAANDGGSEYNWPSV